jgi:biopolymer transport protein ExbB/TolQ
MSGSELTTILKFAGNAIYVGLGLVALYGVFCVVLLVRRIRQKRFGQDSASQAFLDEVETNLKSGKFDQIAEMCDTPPFWSQAVPQLMQIAVMNRHRKATQLRRIVSESFEREVLADLEYRASWISTIVKSAPMLGLLGTVVGMISAFGTIATAQTTGADVTQLAGDISFALFTTALGLTVAIPLVLAGALINVRIGKLQDSVQQFLGGFLDDLSDAAAAEAGGTQ